MQFAFKCLLIGLHLLGIVASISLIGKEREPTTAGTAVFSTLFGMGIIYGLMIWL